MKIMLFYIKDVIALHKNKDYGNQYLPYQYKSNKYHMLLKMYNIFNI